jgi:hypothetical protein
MTESDRARIRGWFAPIVALAAVAGCLHVEVSVQMHENGGATITERVRFTRRLLELDADTPTKQKLARLLDRDAVERRASHMGKGIKIASHKVSELQDGSLESRAVYTIPEIENLRLINPFVHDAAPGRVMRIHFSPIYKRVHSYHKVGELMMYLVPAERPKRRRGDDEEPPPPPTPAELQTLRDLQPVFADLMQGLEFKLRLTATKPISSGAIRHRKSASKTINLISFTASDLDAHGRKFIENEELMLSILLLRFDAPNLVQHSSGFPNNLTVPVLRGRRPYASTRFRIKPTRALFKKYYHGRPKSQGGDQ